jgi:hypothetical protein
LIIVSTHTNDDFIISQGTAHEIKSFSMGKTHITPGQEFHFDYGIDIAHQA